MLRIALSLLLAPIGYGVYLGVLLQLNAWINGDYRKGILGEYSLIVPIGGAMLGLIAPWVIRTGGRSDPPTGEGALSVSDEILSFDEHRRRRDESPDLVRCARCGKPIPATATRCPECRVHFQGEAYEFSHPSERASGRGRAGRWAVVIVAVLLAAWVLSAVGPW
jgi:hypothetical protein